MTEIILAVIALASAPLSAWLTSRLMKAKYAQEVEKLKAEVAQMKSDVRSRELDNDRKSINMVMELVVEPIRKEMKSLQRKVDRLTNAIDKIPSCPHSANSECLQIYAYGPNPSHRLYRSYPLPRYSYQKYL